MMFSSASNSEQKRSNRPDVPTHVVIAGGGVIGTCTAWYLAQNFDIRSTIVDPTGTIAPAASGKAGGFLARDWNDRTPTQDLTRRSFDLHAQLADTLGAERIQYRRHTCRSIQVDPYRNIKPAGKKLQPMEWTQGDHVLGSTLLGDESTIAQVHPKKLCQTLFDENNLSNILKGSVVGVKVEDGKFCGAWLDNGSLVEGDAFLWACGPWTNGLYGIKYHSVVVPTDKVLSETVFFSGCGDPEVYVRPDQTAYCTGFPDPEIIVTEKPGEEEVRSSKINTILESVRDASSGKPGEIDGALKEDPLVTQACYLPSTQQGIPVMGKLPHQVMGCDNCFIAVGHTCWGILLGPASGEAMASLIAEQDATLKVPMQYFDPKSYPDVTPNLSDKKR